MNGKGDVNDLRQKGMKEIWREPCLDLYKLPKIERQSDIVW